MNKFLRSVLYVLTIAAVLMTSALGTTTVFAEDGTTIDPPPEDPVITEPTAEDPVIAEPPADEPAITEPLAEDLVIAEPPAEDPAITEPPTEEASPISQENQDPPEDPITVPEILEQVPEDTSLVVLNTEGTAEPLASQEASEILKKGDPVWCPEGSTPGDSDCSGSHTSFTGLITDLSGGGYSGDGVIWVEANYDRTQDAGSIDFDHTNGNLANLDNLTIMGGWNGVSGSTSTKSSTPSVLDDPILIDNWEGNIKFKNIKFVNALSGDASLEVITDGKITLDNVSVTGNTSGNGASLDNCQDSGGGVCTASGDVIVKNSSFSNNDSDGLNIQSDDNVTLDNITAKNNGGDGVDLDTDDYNINTVNATNLKTSDNGDSELEITGVSGDVTVDDATILNSADDGISIREVGGDVTVDDAKILNSEDDGLYIADVGGNVVLKDVRSYGSLDDEGVDLEDIDGNVTLKKVYASNNDDHGIEMDEVDGNVTVICSVANNNGDEGIDIDDVDGNVVLMCSEFDDNVGTGVEIYDVDGSVQLLSVEASGNGDQNFNIDPTISEVIIKKVECCCEDEEDKDGDYFFDSILFAKLLCKAPDTETSLTNLGGNQVTFNNLCGYKAGIFDKTSPLLPKYIPGGQEYITPLYKKIKEVKPVKPADPKKDPGQDNKDQSGKGIYEKVFEGLPDVLPEGDQYQDSLLVVVLDENGKFYDPLPEGAEVTVMFKVPDGLADDAELSILRWDGLDWEDLGGEKTPDGLYFKTTAVAIGVFVLVVR